MIFERQFKKSDRLKKVFFTPQHPTEPKKGMGYVAIDREVAERINIRPVYRAIGYGGRVHVEGPNGRFTAYCDNPYGFGGRNKRRFKVYSHNEVIELVTQKKLNIEAVLYFVRSWANKDARVITPGKRTINLDKQTAQPPAYVYFVCNPDSNAIKIGIAKNVRRRLTSLQTSSPAELELLGTIKARDEIAARKLEQSLHNKFDRERIRGEWFIAEPRLLQYIKEQT